MRDLAHSLLLLRAWLEPRKALLPKSCKLAFATLEGDRFMLDPAHPEFVHTEWNEASADIVVLTNHRTLADLVAGDFDARLPKPEQVFMWSGDPAIWSGLARATQDSAKGALGAQMKLRRSS